MNNTSHTELFLVDHSDPKQPIFIVTSVEPLNNSHRVLLCDWLHAEIIEILPSPMLWPIRGLQTSWSSAASSLLIDVGLPILRVERSPQDHTNYDPLVFSFTHDQPVLNTKPHGAFAPPPNSLTRKLTHTEWLTYQANQSDHCRHTTFRTKFNGRAWMDIVRSTTTAAPVHTAFDDNSAVFGRPQAELSIINRRYQQTTEVCTTLKAETHNHPTAIHPFEGAATGVGGMLRDLAATGTGGRPRACFSGLALSNLSTQNTSQAVNALAPPWKILEQAPLGAAHFANTFGVPVLGGFLRVFQQKDRGFHKPILYTSGTGTLKVKAPKGLPAAKAVAVVVFGGPSRRVGVGGSTASSKSTDGELSDETIESVQRSDPEIQRRSQHFIERHKCQLLRLNDLGAGGLSVAITELLHEAQLGADLNAAEITTAQPMSPGDLFCNEAQERYAALVHKQHLKQMKLTAHQEGIVLDVLGFCNSSQVLKLVDERWSRPALSLPISLLINTEPLSRTLPALHKIPHPKQPMSALRPGLLAILAHPSVGSKAFLVTLGDRSIGGGVLSEPMVGPRQIAIGNYAMQRLTHGSKVCVATALGERAPLSLGSPESAIEVAVAEALTNLLGAVVARTQIVLSVNWMADSSYLPDVAICHRMVLHLKTICDSLQIGVCTGKDSMSMRSIDGEELTRSPPTAVIMASTQTDEERLHPLFDEGEVVLISLSTVGLAMSVASTLSVSCDGLSPRVNLRDLRLLIDGLPSLKLTALHDVSDGGVWASLCELSFASGLSFFSELLDLPVLLSEGPAVLVQSACPGLQRRCAQLGLVSYVVATLKTGDDCTLQTTKGTEQFSLQGLRQVWQHNHNTMCAFRDGLTESPVLLNCKVPTTKRAPRSLGRRCRVAILRGKGANGHLDLAYAFRTAGATEVVDVQPQHLSQALAHTDILCIPGGFTYSDVLGCGRGVAARMSKNIDALKAFWSRSNTLTLGICNGAQVLCELNQIADLDLSLPSPPKRNLSGRFEGRLCNVSISQNNSPFFRGLTNCTLPVAVAHGFGRFDSEKSPVLQYVDEAQKPTTTYPHNPNGSLLGAAGFLALNGRMLVCMPHPERHIDSAMLPECTFWRYLFENAVTFVKDGAPLSP